jgi:outer membrane immunogenic protein
MRELLHATAALSALLATSLAADAADMHVKAPAPAPTPPVLTWTGFYIGGNIGGAWARRNLSDSSLGLNLGGNDNGVFIGGGQVGFNYQVDTFVIGVEGTFDGAGNNNRTDGTVVPGLRGDLIQISSNDRWVATLAARFGYTGWSGNHVLAYGKAGGGWVGNSDFRITDVTTGASITSSSNNAASGWLVGGGLEWAFAENWSVKVEYDFLGLTQRTLSVPVGSTFLVGDTFATHSNDLQMAVVGLNYRFNWVGPASNPVVSKY